MLPSTVDAAMHCCKVLAHVMAIHSSKNWESKNRRSRSVLPLGGGRPGASGFPLLVLLLPGCSALPRDASPARGLSGILCSQPPSQQWLEPASGCLCTEQLTPPAVSPGAV